MRYIVTGGGTGGHIYPALAIAMEIKKKDKEAEILYVGTEKGLESKLVPKAGFEFATVRVKGMPRSLSKESIKSGIELLKGLSDSKKIIKRFKPDVVIGTGGYVCGPVVFMASRKKIPTVIHEQNAFPGITNKILARFVDRVLITFEEARKYFKSNKIILTGNPIRSSLFEVDKSKAYSSFDLNSEEKVIVSFGGSGGQKKLNESMLYFIKNNMNKDFQIVHVTGERHYEGFINELKKDNIDLNDKVKVLPYVYNMPDLLNIADLIITSSGAITLAEISALGKPSILIPKGYTAENHQEYNANAFKDKGASYVILEKDINGDVLEANIIELMENPEKMKEMAECSYKLGIRDSASKIVEIIDELII